MYINVESIFEHVRTVTYECLLTMTDRTGIKPSYVKARCQHGHTAEEHCSKCDAGYSDTSATWGRFRTFPVIAAMTDDGCDIAYLTASKAKKWDQALSEKTIWEY